VHHRGQGQLCWPFFLRLPRKGVAVHDEPHRHRRRRPCRHRGRGRGPPGRRGRHRLLQRERAAVLPAAPARRGHGPDGAGCDRHAPAGVVRRARHRTPAGCRRDLRRAAGLPPDRGRSRDRLRYAAALLRRAPHPAALPRRAGRAAGLHPLVPGGRPGRPAARAARGAPGRDRRGHARHRVRASRPRTADERHADREGSPPAALPVRRRRRHRAEPPPRRPRGRHAPRRRRRDASRRRRRPRPHRHR
jgi:hypothetical protein